MHQNMNGYINPCSQLTFKVNTNPVAPFVYASKYEWFANGVLVKSTTVTSDPLLTLSIQMKTTQVYCKVTYQTLDGTSPHHLPQIPLLH